MVLIQMVNCGREKNGCDWEIKTFDWLEANVGRLWTSLGFMQKEQGRRKTVAAPLNLWTFETVARTTRLHGFSHGMDRSHILTFLCSHQLSNTAVAKWSNNPHPLPGKTILLLSLSSDRLNLALGLALSPGNFPLDPQ